MTKHELIEKMAAEANISKAAAGRALKEFMQNVTMTLARGEQISLGDLINSDFQPLKIPVDVHDMVRWCRRQGIALDGEARAAYVATQTRAHFG